MIETRAQRNQFVGKGRKKKRLLIIFITILLVAIIALLLVILTPRGNSLMHTVVPSVNTPMDKVVKKQLNNKVASASLPENDKAKLTGLLNDNSMSTLTRAASDPATATTLYAQYTGKDKALARSTIDAIYSNKDLAGLRNSIAENNWLSAIKQYNELAKTNKLATAFDNAEKNSNNSAKKTQEEASKMYNEAVSNQVQQQ